MNAPGPADPAGEFVVHTDRSDIHRRYVMILVGHGILSLVFVALVLWIGSFQLGAWPSLPFLILLVGQIFQLSVQSFAYGSRLAISEPLTINHWGLAMNTAAGRLELPWEAVTGVQLRTVLWRRVLSFQLHPAAGPGTPGVQTSISTNRWAGMRRRGLLLGEKGIHESYEQIRQAVAYFSQGRVPIN